MGACGAYGNVCTHVCIVYIHTLYYIYIYICADKKICIYTILGAHGGEQFSSVRTCKEV